MFVTRCKVVLGQLRSALQAAPVTLENLPAELVTMWKTKDGRSRVEALPKGDPNDNDTLRKFADAVLAAEPNAIGGPVSILKSGDTIVDAFIQAGDLGAGVDRAAALAGAAADHRRAADLVPLLVAGAVTLEICVLIGLPLNFANIIALPLLLGVGVAFKIYYVMAWRAGQTNLLQSSLTRAIFFSALTTATAFGSLWLSSHPGTASMGKLLALSLVTTLAAVLLFQPALMGKPRSGQISPIRVARRWRLPLMAAVPASVVLVAAWRLARAALGAWRPGGLELDGLGIGGPTRPRFRRRRQEAQHAALDLERVVGLEA